MNNQELFYHYCGNDFLPAVKHLVESHKVDIYADDEKAFSMSLTGNKKHYQRSPVTHSSKVFDYLVNIRTPGIKATLNDTFRWVWAPALKKELLSESTILSSLVGGIINNDNTIKIKTKRTNKKNLGFSRKTRKSKKVWRG